MQFLENLLNNLDNFLIVVFAIGALMGGIMMLILRDPMDVAISLVSAMMFLAGIYGLIEVHFIAAFQVLIYVGAVMVFMIFIIMLLSNCDKSMMNKYSPMLPYTLTISMMFFICFFILFTKIDITHINRLTSFSVSDFSKVFMREYWFQFILVAVLLLESVVATITILKPQFPNILDNLDTAEVKNG